MLKIGDIKIGPRFRKELGDIELLAKSIKETGLIHPPTVNEKNELIAGHRRIKACEYLGMKKVPVTKINLNDFLRGELDENIIRLGFSIDERVNIGLALEGREKEMAGKRKAQATGKPRGVKKVSSENFTEEKGEALEKVASAVGWSRPTYEKAKAVVVAIEEFPEKYGNLEEKLREGTIDSTFKEYARRKEVEARLKDKPQKITDLVLGDAFEELKKIPDNSIDCILTDPPYGIDYHPTSSRFEKVHGDTKEIFPLLRNVSKELYRVAKPNSHLYCFCGWKDSYCSIYTTIERAGFEIADCIVWVKDQRTTGTDFTHKYAHKHEFIIFAHKGSRCLNKPFSPDALQFKKVHDGYCATQKPIELLKYLIENSTVEGETVLDPFCGSGSTLVAAEELGRNWIGIEIDKHWYDVARARIHELRKNKGVVEDAES